MRSIRYISLLLLMYLLAACSRSATETAPADSAVRSTSRPDSTGVLPTGTSSTDSGNTTERGGNTMGSGG